VAPNAWLPAGLPLFLLEEGDCQALAAHLSCGQDIAGDGAFSLAMIADYAGGIGATAPPSTRTCSGKPESSVRCWYLEAEEPGIRATGIGCYFDELVHELFGLSRGWQTCRVPSSAWADDLRLPRLRRRPFFRTPATWGVSPRVGGA